MRHSVKKLLLSHHPPEHLDRTLQVGFKGARVHVCARCTGALGGLLVGVAALAIMGVPRLEPIPGAAVVAVLAGPAMIDFSVQLLTGYCSRNLRRVLTGFAFGMAVALAAGELAIGKPTCAATVAALLAIYLVLLCTGTRRRERLTEHLLRYREYYLRCRAEDARRAVQRLK